MTLINFVTRVHFADGVLEEALHSEMELHAKRRPMIIAEEGHLDGPVAERFFSNFPIRTRAETFSAVPMRASESVAREIAARYRDLSCDLLIAFGSTRSMDLAKVARIASPTTSRSRRFPAKRAARSGSRRTCRISTRSPGCSASPRRSRTKRA